MPKKALRRSEMTEEDRQRCRLWDHNRHIRDREKRLAANRALSRRRREEDPEGVLAAERARHEKRRRLKPDEVRAYDRKWKAEWRAKCPEKARQAERNRQERHPDRNTILGRQIRAKKRIAQAEMMLALELAVLELPEPKGVDCG